MGFVCIEADKLYEKDKKLKREDVEILQDWLKKQPHLPRLEDAQVAVFLHSCYYRVESAKLTIDNYFTLRTHHPELFTHLNEDSLRKCLSSVLVSILPKKTPQSYYIVLLKLTDLRPENFNFCDGLKLLDMIGTLEMHKEGFDCGAVAVFDCRGFSFGHLAKINLSVLRHAINHVQEGSPVRIKGIHFINVTPVIDKVLTIAKPFVKSELFGYLQVHSSNETLYKYVPLDCLPEDYGGQSPSCQILQEETVETLLQNYDFFDWHESQKVDEAKRLGKSKCIYGTEGTFKKLELD